MAKSDMKFNLILLLFDRPYSEKQHKIKWNIIPIYINPPQNKTLQKQSLTVHTAFLLLALIWLSCSLAKQFSVRKGQNDLALQHEWLLQSLAAVKELFFLKIKRNVKCYYLFAVYNNIKDPHPYFIQPTVEEILTSSVTF